MAHEIECWDCGGEGVIEGECTCWEDCCCCAEPEPPECQTCRGRGFLMVTDDVVDTHSPQETTDV